jgi:hypothetical protein
MSGYAREPRWFGDERGLPPCRDPEHRHNGPCETWTLPPIAWRDNVQKTTTIDGNPFRVTHTHRPTGLTTAAVGGDLNRLNELCGAEMSRLLDDHAAALARPTTSAHRPETVTVLAGPCAQETCEHSGSADDSCEWREIQVCTACSYDGVDLGRVDSVPVTPWPCALARTTRERWTIRLLATGDVGGSFEREADARECARRLTDAGHDVEVARPTGEQQ